ncbi:MAG: hypothetical protein JXA94_05810 [Parachlamydiales bacterium]|nr:hypothetical protein [Parachlamydiales bacterium]
MSSKSEVKLNQTGHFFNGVASSLSMTTVMQPVFTLKTYVMQGAGKPAIRNLYRGYFSNCASVVPSQGIAYLTNGVMNKTLKKEEGKSSTAKELAYSIIPGSAASPWATACERVMIVQQLQGGSTKDALTKIVKKEGVRGLAKGFTPTLARESLFSLGLFGLRNTLDKKLEPKVQNRKIREATSSVVAGAAAGFASAPFDRLKTKVQSDLKGSSSWLKEGRKIVVKEGVRGLFKGAGVRAGLVSGAMSVMTVAEKQLPKYYPKFSHQES